MSSFLHDDFLLGSPTARRLFHEVAAPLPVVDFHCHLDPQVLAQNRRFGDLTELWIAHDPYKHRAMRMAGVPERVITGPASAREKFDAWAATVPRTIGNPLHHWTALELQRYFAIEEPLTAESAERIWTAANARLVEPAFTARGLLAQRHVHCLCTSDRLLDDLSPHAMLAREGGTLRVWPSLRADDLVAVEQAGFPAWVRELGTAVGGEISNYDDFRAAVTRRLDYFSAAGCRLSDHGIDDFRYQTVNDAETAALFGRRLGGEVLPLIEAMRLRSGLLRFLGASYAQRGWIMQVHLGAQRHTSSRLRRLVGPAGGYAGIGGGCDIPSLVAWLDDLERVDALPRTVLYPLNAADFAPLAVLSGSFVEDGVPGKVQLGPAWWFNDHAAGMRAQLEASANYGLLSVFIGMTTDSRSLLSMVRHEYFRRIACDWIGAQAETGALPAATGELTALVRALCHDNAARALSL